MAANAVLTRLVERYGLAVPGLAQLHLTHLFPEPEVLATADLGDLDDLDLGRTITTAIQGFAAATVDGTIRLDRSVGLEQLVAAINAVPGVEAPIGEYVALRLGELDAFPLSDDPTVTRPGSAEAWRPWRALAVTHLWLAGRLPEQLDRLGVA